MGIQALFIEKWARALSFEELQSSRLLGGHFLHLNKRYGNAMLNSSKKSVKFGKTSLKTVYHFTADFVLILLEL